MARFERGGKHPEKPKPLVDQPLRYEGTDIDDLFKTSPFAGVSDFEKKRAKVDLISLRQALREQGISPEVVGQVFEERLKALATPRLDQRFASEQTINALIPNLSRGQKSSKNFWERFASLRASVAEGATSLPEREVDLWSSKDNFMKRVNEVLEIKKHDGLITTEEVKLYQTIARKIWDRDQVWKKFARIPYTDAFFSPGLSTFWPNTKEGSHAVRVGDLALWLMDEKPFWEQSRLKRSGELSDLQYEKKEADSIKEIAKLKQEEAERRRAKASARIMRAKSWFGKGAPSTESDKIPSEKSSVETPAPDDVAPRKEGPAPLPRLARSDSDKGLSDEQQKRLAEIRKRLGLESSDS